MWIIGVFTVLSALTGGPEPWDLARLAMYRHQEPVPAARIWFDRGVDPVLQRGDRVRVHYRSTVTAFVSIFQVDTDGTVRLMYPRSPGENHYARANRDYRLLFPRSPYWNVGDRPGVGYFFIVTSPLPFDFSDFRYSYYDGGWDLSVVGNRVYEDPYVAMDDYVERLIPDWEYVSYGLDFVSYSIGASHEYPRFLCYDCHGFKPFNVWNPYRYTCTNFRVIIYDDPYFYLARRYGGDQVVLVGRSVPSGPRFGFKERGRGEPGTPMVRRVPAPGRDTDSEVVDRTRGRAIPRATGLRDPSSGGDARVRPPTTRQGEADRPGARDGTRGGRPAATPDPKRPVLERRPPASSRPSDGARVTPRPRGDNRAPRARATPPKSTATRGRSSLPAVRKPPARSTPSSPPAVRRPPARSTPSSPPVVRRPPARSKPSAPPAARRPPPRSGGSAATRSGLTRPQPVAKRPPPKRSSGAASSGSRPPPRPRRPGG